MKWYEVMDNLGDGTCRARRFKTREQAQAWRDAMENYPYFQCDGDDSPVIEVDTESLYFFDDPTDDIEAFGNVS
jgi:hypothetical protein